MYIHYEVTKSFFPRLIDRCRGQWKALSYKPVGQFGLTLIGAFTIPLLCLNLLFFEIVVVKPCVSHFTSFVSSQAHLKAGRAMLEQQECKYKDTFSALHFDEIIMRLSWANPSLFIPNTSQIIRCRYREMSKPRPSLSGMGMSRITTRRCHNSQTSNWRSFD